MITLNLLEKYPESKELQGEVAEVLTKRLEENPEIATQLENLLQPENKSSKTSSCTFGSPFGNRTCTTPF